MAHSDRWDHSLDATARHETAEHGPILTPVEARQGVISGRVRLILAVSLTLVVVAFAIIYSIPV